MRIRDLNETVEKVQNPSELSKQNKKKLTDVLSSMFDTIQRVEKDGDIHLKSDKEKIDLLKNLISDMVKQIEREKIIKGGQWWNLKILPMI